MRTLLILVEGANYVQINPPSTHSRCVHLECKAVEVGPRGTSGSTTPACQQTKVAMHQRAKCAMAMTTTAASSPPMMCIMAKR